MIEIIPVLDLKSGIAVSGKSGERNNYKPLKTIYSSSSNPVEIAKILKEKGTKRIYIADLDAIEGNGSNHDIIKRINDIIPVILDAGANDVNKVNNLLKFVDKVIVATETLITFKDLDEIFKTFSKRELIISIDCKEGHILSKKSDLTFKKFERKLKELKPDEIIILDISGVGTQRGFNHNLLNEMEDWENYLILGGSINLKNMKALHKKGINKFLLGSALHSGQIMHPFKLN
ncbi:MAG: HisA/HisF family protein [Methanobacterium sp.]|jgi:phosphoribosylformimino-5-aminoimidazole carboxamide ribotide isomerase